MKSIYRGARQLPTALEGIPGAIRGTPLTEPDRPGSMIAEEIARVRANAPKILMEDRLGALSDDDEDEDDAISSSAPVFWTPPDVQDDDVYRRLEESREGEYLRQSKLLGIDAFGYYASFHQRTYQWGIYIPLDGVAALAKQALGHLDLDIGLKFEIAWSFILAHERFHYAADCGIGQLELLLGKPIWWSRRGHEFEEELRQLEEKLATGYSLFKARRPPVHLRVKGALQALTDFTRRLPAGYREGHLIARSRHALENDMLEHAQRHWELTTGRSYVQAEMQQLYPAFREYDLTKCPVHRIFPATVVDAVLIQKIEHIQEEQAFLKQLRRYPELIVERWQKTKQKLAASVMLKGLDFKPWPKLGRLVFRPRRYQYASPPSLRR